MKASEESQDKKRNSMQKIVTVQSLQRTNDDIANRALEWNPKGYQEREGPKETQIRTVLKKINNKKNQ